MANDSAPERPGPGAFSARERALLAKRRELSAHLRAVRLHRQAAEIQRRLGHDDEADAALERATRAQELYDIAMSELTEWDMPASS